MDARKGESPPSLANKIQHGMNAESATNAYAHLINGCDPKIELTPEEAARYWAKVDKTSSPRGCWLWTAAIHKKKGYGSARMRGRNYAAHRLSYQMHKGAIPDTLLVCHQCDVRNCVNPDHLWLGTNKANMKDMADKGRAADGWQVPRGENCHNSKLSESDVLEIRKLYAAGGVSQYELADKFGVQQTQIGRITRGLRWRHISTEAIPRTDIKLSEIQIIEIRKIYDTGTVSQATLASQYGVSQVQISRLIRGTRRPELGLTPITKGASLRGRRTV